MTLCQKDVKLFSASIGRKQSVSKLNMSAFWRLPKSHFHVQEIIIVDLWRSLVLATPPTQECKPMSAIIVTNGLL